MDAKKSIKNILDEIDSLNTTINAINENIKTIKSEVLMLSSQIPDEIISDDVRVLKQLKYKQIVYNDTDTWQYIEELPTEVIMKWNLKIWFFVKYEFTYQKKEEFEKLLGITGRKSVDSWCWYIKDYLNSVCIDPNSASSCLHNAITAHNRGTKVSKEYMKNLFNLLDEEILLYEQRNK